MIALAEEVVAHLAPVHHVERFGMGPEAEDFADIDFAGNVDVMGKAAKPILEPIRSERFFHLGAEAPLDRLNGRLGAVVMFKGADVFVEIGRAGRPDAQGVDLRAGEAVEVVEDHRAERRAKVRELLRRGI